jgi:hypothetical protein
MEIFIFWLIVAGATSVIAVSKGRNGFGWFCIGFALSLIGLVMVCAMPAQK